MKMAKETSTMENAERELKYHEFRMKQEWRKVENRLALMDLRLERAKEVRDQYIDFLQTKYPQWKPNFRTFQRHVSFAQPSVTSLVDELSTAKHHYIEDKPRTNFAQVLQTSKLLPKSPIPSSNSTLLKSDLDLIKRRLTDISTDLQSLRESRLELSRSDFSAQNRSNVELPVNDNEFFHRTTSVVPDSFSQDRHRSLSQPPPIRLPVETTEKSMVPQRESIGQADRTTGNIDMLIRNKEHEEADEPIRLARSQLFQKELKEVNELLSEQPPRNADHSTSDNAASYSDTASTQRRARFDFSAKTQEAVPDVVVQKESTDNPAENKSDDQLSKNSAAAQNTTIVPVVPPAITVPVTRSIIAQPIPQIFPPKQEPPSASYQQMLGLISNTTQSSTKPDESSETDSLEERLAIGKKKPAPKQEPMKQEQKITAVVAENSQSKTEKKPGEEFLAKLFPDKKTNVPTSVQTKKIIFGGESSSDESVDLPGKAAGNDSDSDFFG